MIDAAEFVELDALERIRAIDDAYGDKALQLASMQKTSCVIMHMIHRLKARTVILFVDTQFHFKSTLDLRDEYARRYDLNFVTVAPKFTPAEQRHWYGRQLYQYVDGQPECCELRKEQPFLKFAREHGIQATIAGLMRDEGGARGKIEPIVADPRIGATTFHPIFDWTYDQLEDYIREHDLPVHPLYERNFLSIGCAQCTTAVRAGEGRRAGRWRHLRSDDGHQPQYCNINFSDLGGGI